jgi:hypothetical protein
MGPIDGYAGSNLITPEQERGKLCWQAIEIEDSQSGLRLEAIVNFERRFVTESEHPTHGASGVLPLKLRINPRRRAESNAIRLQRLERCARSVQSVKSFEFSIPPPQDTQSLNGFLNRGRIAIRGAHSEARRDFNANHTLSQKVMESNAHELGELEQLRVRRAPFPLLDCHHSGARNS